jgi:hypothetical protein
MRVEKAHPFWGWLCIALGLFPILVVTGVFDFGQADANAPAWVIIITGMVFVLAGSMILAGQHSRFTAWCAVLLCACFGVVGAWVSLAAPGEGFSGGIPFAPDSFNIALARWVFGMGAGISFLIAFFAFRQAWKNHEPTSDR